MHPDSRVVVDGPLVDEDHCVLWYGVAHDGGVPGGAVGDGEGHEAGEAHHLVDEGHDVWQLGLVLDGGQAATVHYLVHFLLETYLHFREPAFIESKVNTQIIEIYTKCMVGDL